jgi:hypothetical protein
MTWQEILSRITGFSVPIFGIQWNPPEAERSVVKRVLTFLEDRRVLYSLTEYEYPDACEKSVELIREKLSDEIGKLESTTELAKNLRAMRAACRAFLNAVQAKNLIVTRLNNYPYPAKHWEFIEALEALRKDFGYRIAALAVSYGIDVESELQSVLPPELEADDI